MKDTGFLIKVWDLLRNVGTEDSITFDWKTTTKIENLAWKISWKVDLQSLNDTTVLVDLELKTSLKQVCDFWWEDFIQDIDLTDIQAQYMLPISLEHWDEKIHDEEYIIDPSFETIDLEELVVQSILLQENIVNVCPTHQPEYEKNAVELDEEYSQQGWNISFNFKSLWTD